MLHRGNLRHKLKSKNGFTLIEIMVVLVIIGILAAIAAPSLLGFIEHGKQINRSNIARTVYLAAQNQLTELRVTKALKAAQTVGDSSGIPPVAPGFLGEYYEKDGDTYKEVAAKIKTNHVYGPDLLGGMPATEDPSNEFYVHYISKPKGSYPDSAVVKLLDPVIVDKSILNEAILIEYNIRTGVVLSAFYGDAVKDGESFVYDDAAADQKLNIKGSRIYTDAESRKQGYYGVGETGVISDPIPAYINVYDSNNEPLPDAASASNVNVLYADIKIPVDKISEPFDLLINGDVVEAGINLVSVSPATSLGSALIQYNTLPVAVRKTVLAYRCADYVDIENTVDMAHFIWVLDYVGGDMVTANVQHSIGVKYAEKASLDGQTNLRVGIKGSVSATSPTEAHPYFNTETAVSYGREEFSVLTPRHLYNIRYRVGGSFTQKNDIDLTAISNFAPVAGKDSGGNPAPFTGKYTGTGFCVSNLTIDISSDNAGLFSVISNRGSGNASVLGLALENPNIKGNNNVGAVCGTLNGFVSGVYVRYSTDSTKIIEGASNVGGITGENGSTGLIADTVFISPTAIPHIKSADVDTAGGIAGNNMSGGKLQRLMFLSLAPEKGSDGKIRPIIGSGAVADNKLYYLSGEAIRPAEVPAGSGLTNYNTESDNGVGSGVGTDDLYFEYRALLSNNWKITTDSLTGEEPLNPDNEFYPYPYSEPSEDNIAKHPHWPIVKGGGVITINHIAYYEEYESSTGNTTYGLWFVDNIEENSDSLKPDTDVRTIKEAGYVILLDKEMSGTHHFFASDTVKADDEWGVADKIEQLNFVESPEFIDAAVNAGKDAFTDKAWAFKLPLDKLYAKGKQSAPLQIMYTMNSDGDNPKKISGFLQPMFAKGLYEAGEDESESGSVVQPDPDTFYVRTQWQMRNISVLTARDVGANNETNGKTFTQELNLDFDNTGTGVHVDGSVTPYPGLNKAAVTGIFEGTYSGKTISNANITANAQECGLFVQNNGTIQEITLKDSSVTGGTERIGGIVGFNAGTVEDCTVSNTPVTGGIQCVGGVAGLNLGTIEKCMVSDAPVTGNTQYIGGVAGVNQGEIEKCMVSRVPVSGNGHIGAVAGTNQGATSAIKSTGVENSAVTGTQPVGGVAGSNQGTVEDVYFLSTNELENVPVQGGDDGGGGIVGFNDDGEGSGLKGLVTRALYLAPAPYKSSENIMYPIVRNGTPAEKTAGTTDTETGETIDGSETCFYLAGYRYLPRRGRSWIPAANYNLVRTGYTREGGGAGLATKFIDIEWLDFAYETKFSNWFELSTGYPYPIIRDVPRPEDWSEADSPARPDQEDREDWYTYTSERANNLGFINGGFDEPLMNPNDSSTYNIFRIPQITSAPTSGSATNGGFTTNMPNGAIGKDGSDYYGMYIYYNSEWVQGWNTRPVRESDYNNSLWNMMEFQRPYPYNLANSGRYGRMRTNYEGGLTGAYVELNADVPGTLYQICETTPGSEFYYSFYHARRNAGNTGGSQRMNFYLSGMRNENNSWQYIDQSGRPTIIRPCITRRADTPNNTTTQYNTSTVTRQTVLYGTTGTDGAETVSVGKVDFYDPKTKTTRNAYLVDVWVSNEAAGSTAQPTSSSTGYGITFWTDTLPSTSTGTALNQISPYGVKNLTTAKSSTGANNAGQFYLPSALIAAARDNVIGYWDVKRFGNGSGDFSEWKQYYGRYTIPAGQNATEFAYESASTRNEKEGNYLDGITFQSPGFLSIQKYAKMNGNEVKFVQPGDGINPGTEPVQIELAIKNWGEVPVNSIVIEDQFHPFDQYIEYGGSMSVRKRDVNNNTTTVTGSTISTPSGSGKTAQTLKLTLPAGTTLAMNEQLTVTFNINVLNEVKSEGGVPTLLYFFRNQAAVTYWDGDNNLKAYSSGYKVDATGYPDYIKQNASGPEPVQVFIDPIKLTKEVDPHINGPFEITLTVQNTMDEGTIRTKGIISDIIPEGFEVDESTLPTGAYITKNTDGTTRITIRDVALSSSVKELEYTYTVKYTGKGYGIAYTSVTSDYKYLYNAGTGDSDVQLNFPQAVVGVTVKTEADVFEDQIAKGAARNYDILANDSFFEKLADDGYDVAPVVILLKKNADGTFGPDPADKNPNGDYQVSEANRYTAALLNSTKELTFTVNTNCPSGTYTHKIYYQIKLTATKPGGATYHLDSIPTEITVTVTVP